MFDIIMISYLYERVNTKSNILEKLRKKGCIFEAFII